MNRKAAKALKEISEITGKSYRAIKGKYLEKNHTQRAAIVASVPAMRAMYEAKLAEYLQEDSKEVIHVDQT